MNQKYFEKKIDGERTIEEIVDEMDSFILSKYLKKKKILNSEKKVNFYSVIIGTELLNGRKKKMLTLHF